MGLGYPPPTPSRQKPLGADFGGSRSIGSPARPEPRTVAGRRAGAGGSPGENRGWTWARTAR